MKRIKDMRYGGVYGSVRYSGLEECFFGKIKGISDLVTYTGQTKEELYQEFMVAVDMWFKDRIKISKSTKSLKNKG